MSGKYDEYIDCFVEGVKVFNERVFMCFLYEFNGNWYVWSGNKNGKVEGGFEKVIEVWKYVVDWFCKVGVDNVKWLWVFYGFFIDFLIEVWNVVVNYWLGDEYVDWIGFDGYNFYL